jgi:hypothetical protein
MFKREHGPEEDNKEKPMSSVLNYLLEKNRTLINDYRAPDSNYAESCTLIAMDIAKILLGEGKRPEIISVTGKRVANPSIIANEPLKPVQYDGRVSWGAHIVCACDGLIYDPMIGRPMPTDKYAQDAFGDDVEMQTIVTKDKIEEFVGR